MKNQFKKEIKKNQTELGRIFDFVLLLPCFQYIGERGQMSALNKVILGETLLAKW